MVWTIHCKLELCVSSNWHTLTWPFSYSLDKRRKRQVSSQGGRLDTDLGAAQVHGNLKKSEWEELSKGLRATTLRVQTSLSKTMECCMCLLTCFSLMPEDHLQTKRVTGRRKQAAICRFHPRPCKCFPCKTDLPQGDSL